MEVMMIMEENIVLAEIVGGREEVVEVVEVVEEVEVVKVEIVKVEVVKMEVVKVEVVVVEQKCFAAWCGLTGSHS